MKLLIYEQNHNDKDLEVEIEKTFDEKFIRIEFEQYKLFIPVEAFIGVLKEEKAKPK